MGPAPYPDWKLELEKLKNLFEKQIRTRRLVLKMVKELQVVADRNVRAIAKQADSQLAILELATRQDAESERTADAAADLIEVMALMLESRKKQ